MPGVRDTVTGFQATRSERETPQKMVSLHRYNIPSFGLREKRNLPRVENSAWFRGQDILEQVAPQEERVTYRPSFAWRFRVPHIQRHGNCVPL